MNLQLTTIPEVLASSVARFADSTYLIALQDGRRFSYREIETITRRLANGLLGAGVAKGAHVAVMMGNHVEHAFALFALARIGALAVLVNTAAKGELLRHFLSLSEATVLIADGEFAQRLDDLPRGATGLKTLILAGESQGTFDTRLESFELSSLLEGADRELEVDVKPADPAHIIFTSGTTGPSKGVLYSHARTVLYAYDILRNFKLTAVDRAYCWMPLFHATGLHGGLLSELLAGGSVALSPRFSASRFVEEVRSSKSTVVIHQGATLHMLMAQPASADDRRHQVRLCLSVPVPPNRNEFEARFAMPVSGCYGLTDCGMPAWLPADSPAEKAGSCGRPSNGWQIRIANEDGSAAAVDSVGEITMRSEIDTANSAIYYADPRATAAAWRNGWFHTGDRGRIDADGYLWYVGRSKDSIRRRGENVSAFEVEQALLRHPAVAEAAVFPVNSELSEDEVAAAIIRRPGASVSEAELVEFCFANLPKYMVPRYLEFVGDLPRNLSQRVQKFVLTEMANANKLSLWDRDAATRPIMENLRRSS